jgi:hypothetical protein
MQASPASRTQRDANRDPHDGSSVDSAMLQFPGGHTSEVHQACKRRPPRPRHRQSPHATALTRCQHRRGSGSFPDCQFFQWFFLFDTPSRCLGRTVTREEAALATQVRRAAAAWSEGRPERRLLIELRALAHLAEVSDSWEASLHTRIGYGDGCGLGDP